MRSFCFFQSFLPKAEERLNAVSAKLEELQKSYKELLAFYGEDPKVEAEDFFSMLNNFVMSFEKAKQDNRRRKALEEKAKLAEKKKLEVRYYKCYLFQRTFSTPHRQLKRKHYGVAPRQTRTIF